jgi:hypothetical protein
MSPGSPTRKASSKFTTSIRDLKISGPIAITHEAGFMAPPPPPIPNIQQDIIGYSEGFSPLESHPEQTPSNFEEPHTPTPTPSGPSTPGSEKERSPLPVPILPRKVEKAKKKTVETGLPSRLSRYSRFSNATTLVNEDLDDISYEITDKATDRPKASATQAGRQSASSYYHEGLGFKDFNVPELVSGLSIYKAANLKPYRAGKMPKKKDGLSGRASHVMAIA